MINFKVDDSLVGKIPEMPQRWSTTDKDVNTFPGFLTKCFLNLMCNFPSLYKKYSRFKFQAL